jgi:Phage integrase family
MDANIPKTSLPFYARVSTNPVKRVKFFQEINVGRRTLSEDEEKRLLANATPYIQDVVILAVNTGLRIGEILTLTWKMVDLENDLLNVFAPKTQKNSTDSFDQRVASSFGVLGDGQEKRVRFLQPRKWKTVCGSRCRCREGVQKSQHLWGNVAYLASYVCLSAGESRRGYSDSATVARTFDSDRYDALYPHKSRLENATLSRNSKILVTVW